jgi:hypothetical protein
MGFWALDIIEIYFGKEYLRKLALNNETNCPIQVITN